MEEFSLDLTWVLDFFVPYIEVLVGALVGWIVLRVRAYTGMSMEAQHRLALHSALMTGVNAALARVKADGKLTAKNKNEVIWRANNYAQLAVPGAIKFFNLTATHLEVMLEAKLQERVE